MKIMAVMRKKDVTGLAAFKYIREELSKGLSLSEYLNNTLTIETGRVYSFVPEDAPENEVYNFDYGMLYGSDSLRKEGQFVMPVRNDATPMVISEIQEYLNLNNTKCCLFEDCTQWAGDFALESSGIEYQKYNTRNIYYFFGLGNNNLEKITDAFFSSNSYVFLCAFSNLDVEEQRKIIPFSEITVESMKLFVTNASSIIVKAYDGEGYLIWISADKLI